MLFFLSFLFFFFSFSICKIGEQEGRTGPAQGGGLAPVGGELVEKEGRRVNLMQIMYEHVCKCKNDTF
jgi:hypothetical protein